MLSCGITNLVMLGCIPQAIQSHLPMLLNLVHNIYIPKIDVDDLLALKYSNSGILNLKDAYNFTSTPLNTKC